MFFKSNQFRLAFFVFGLAIYLSSAGCRKNEQDGTHRSTATAIDPDDLCKRITKTLKQTQDGRQLSTELQGAWQIVHGILAFGEQFTVLHESVTVPALEYLLEGGTLQGWKLRPGENGIIALVEEGSTLGQGHQDQWLGYLSQCGKSGIPLETPLIVGDTSATVDDLLRQAQADLHTGQEATWTLMALATYLQEDETWEASNGETWNLSRVIEMELDTDLHSSACGGSHRLYGLATAVNTYRSRHPEAGESLPEPWKAAEKTISDSIELSRRFQQADGSFSTQFFERPASSADVFAKLSSSGHIFEFLAVALPVKRLHE
ncbi:MAG: hypothetical protein ABGW75_08140, partial [Pirellulales bacterium]